MKKEDLKFVTEWDKTFPKKEGQSCGTVFFFLL